MCDLSGTRAGFDEVLIRLPSGRRIVLRLGFRAYLAYEAATGEAAIEAIARFERGQMVKITDLAQLVCAAALQHQPDFTLGEAADVLEMRPNIVADMIRASLPEAAKGGQQGKKENPPRRFPWRVFFRRG